MTDLIEQLKNDLEPSDGATFFSYVPQLKKLVAEGYPARAVEADLTRVCGNPSYHGDWRPNEIYLHRSDKVGLSVWYYERQRHYIHTIPYHTILIPCGRVGLRYHRYRLPTGFDSRVFDRTLKIELVDEGYTPPGEALELCAGWLIHDFLIERPTPVLKFEFGPIETTKWMFHRDSGLAWKMSDSSSAATQLRVAAHILGRMARTTSIEPLVSLTQHPSHTVRWAAIQNLSRISKSMAVECLKIARTDPHPDIRRAANRTLDAAMSKQVL